MQTNLAGTSKENRQALVDFLFFCCIVLRNLWLIFPCGQKNAISLLHEGKIDYDDVLAYIETRSDCSKYDPYLFNTTGRHFRL